MILTISLDVLHTIKSFLSYRDRSQFLVVCKLFSFLKIDRFYLVSFFSTVISLQRKRYYQSTQQICVNTFDPLFVPCPFFISKGMQIIIYDTPHSYYDIRIFKSFDSTKKLEEYLSEYGKDTRDYFIRRKKPTLYVSSKL